MLITANQPFGQWEAIFPDRAMTVAAIDRLVHRASIFELNVDSYRRRTAIENKRKRRRPPDAQNAATDTAAEIPAPIAAPQRVFSRAVVSGYPRDPAIPTNLRLIGTHGR